MEAVEHGLRALAPGVAGLRATRVGRRRRAQSAARRGRGASTGRNRASGNGQDAGSSRQAATPASTTRPLSASLTKSLARDSQYACGAVASRRGLYALEEEAKHPWVKGSHCRSALSSQWRTATVTVVLVAILALTLAFARC